MNLLKLSNFWSALHFFYLFVIFIKITNDTNEGRRVDIDRGAGFAQGIFMPYGITVDDDCTSIRNGGFGSTDQGRAQQ